MLSFPCFKEPEQPEHNGLVRKSPADDLQYFRREISAGETFHDGSNTLTQISALLFRGHHAPQPRAVATP
jgi:hypothetical protein